MALSAILDVRTSSHHIIHFFIWILARFTKSAQLRLWINSVYFFIGWTTIAYFISSFVFVHSEEDYRRVEDKAMRGVIQRAEPLIAALDQYHNEEGEYPDSLQDLVPKYLSEIPQAGLARCPEFHYWKPKKPVGDWKDVGYELDVDLGIRDIYFRRMFYWPSHRYPESKGYFIREPIDDWIFEKGLRP